MFEERRWGEYKVVDTAEFSDGYKSLTKQRIPCTKVFPLSGKRYDGYRLRFLPESGKTLVQDVYKRQAGKRRFFQPLVQG